MAKTVFKTLGVTAGLTTAMVLTGLSTQTFAMAPFQPIISLATMEKYGFCYPYLEQIW